MHCPIRDRRPRDRSAVPRAHCLKEKAKSLSIKKRLNNRKEVLDVLKYYLAVLRKCLSTLSRPNALTTKDIGTNPAIIEER